MKSPSFPERSEARTRPGWLNRLSKIRPATVPNEPALHRVVEGILKDAGVDYRHEHPFTATERIDFIVDEADGFRWGIECKLNPDGMAIWRQAFRYADHCDAVIILTTRPLSAILKPHGEHRAKEFVVVELCKNF